MPPGLSQPAPLDLDLRLGRLPRNLTQLGAVGVFVPPPPPGSQQTIVAGNILRGPKMQTMGSQGKSVEQYLTHGKGPQGSEATLFTQDGQQVDMGRFMQQAQHDPHQFRFSVSLRDRQPFFAFQPYVETLMRQVENDLGRRLDWVAAVHHDTAHPHAHVILRGRDMESTPLFIKNDYLTYGLRARADTIATWLLGPEKGRDRARTQERRTQLSLGHTAEQRRGQEMGL